MGFKDAVRTCLRDKYVTFSGRASRSEFWWFTLFCLLIVVALFALGFALGGFGVLMSGNFDAFFGGSLAVVAILFLLFILAIILPSISVTVRRFHDVNLSGWWYLGCLIVSGIAPEQGLLSIVGLLASLAPYVIGLIRGTEGENKYGPDPLVEQTTADVFA